MGYVSLDLRRYYINKCLVPFGPEIRGIPDTRLIGPVVDCVYLLEIICISSALAERVARVKQEILWIVWIAMDSMDFSAREINSPNTK